MPLFTAATPPGGTASTDTLGAVLDIALNPGNNASALYALPPPVVAFPTTLTQPTDWTIAVKYTGGGINNPGNLAIDAANNVWITNAATGGALSEFNNVGVSQQGSTGVVFTSTMESYGIAIAPIRNDLGG